jgi:FKBP12-rapamycin complex-associated protein
LRDKTLNVFNVNEISILDCMISIFIKLNKKIIIHFLPLIINNLIFLIKNANNIEKTNFYLQRLNTIIKFLKNISLESYLIDLINLINFIWENNKNINKILIITIQENIILNLKKKIKPHLFNMLQNLLNEFENYSKILNNNFYFENNKNNDNNIENTIIKILDSFILYGEYFDDNILDLILNTILNIIEKTKEENIIIKILNVIEILCNKGKVDFSEFSSRIVLTICRILNNNNLSSKIKIISMDTLSSIIYLMGYDFLIYLSIVSKSITKNNIIHERYNALISQLLKNRNYEILFSDNESEDEKLDNIDDEEIFNNEDKNSNINFEKLSKIWKTNAANPDDWLDWLKKLSNEFLIESPSFFLRICSKIAINIPILSKELFNCSFYLIWNELNEEYKKNLIYSIEMCLSFPNLPVEILQTLLDLGIFQNK